jgi:hypothetical protein
MFIAGFNIQQQIQLCICTSTYGVISGLGNCGGECWQERKKILCLALAYEQ